MTRLTAELIKDVPEDKIDLDSHLLETTGKTVKGLALEAAGLPDDTDLSGFKVACVPITSGLGLIGGFSKSVDSIVRRLGMDSRVTEDADVLGFSQGVLDGADIIMMSDDPKFIAYNTRENKFIDNSWGTALGYSVALKNAAGGLEGKDVFVIGAGRVGSRAAGILKGMGAKVHIYDIVNEKAEEVGMEHEVDVIFDLEKALSEYELILNAAPLEFEGRMIREGSIFSTPGVPHGFDEEGRRKAKAIIHDPLEIGTAIMAVCSAAFSLK